MLDLFVIELDMRKIILIAHNIRSTHNVGSLLRTADGLGVERVYLTGYTPYPAIRDDSRMPHIARKVDERITKTALGAEKSVDWEHEPDAEAVINKLKERGFNIVALEQAPNSIKLPAYKPLEKIVVVVGREVEGIEPDVLELCDSVVEIPMYGKKESFNVAVAAAIALYQMRFMV